MKTLTSLIIIALLLFVLIDDASAKTKRSRKVSTPTSQGVYLKSPNPTTPLEHNNRGVELGSKGLWADAIREHEIALHDAPGNQTFRTNLSAAHLRYGDILKGKGDYYNAIKQYRHALYVDPNNQPADVHLDECLTHLKKDPTNAKVRQLMAEDADVSQDYETAIVEYRKLVKMLDDGPSHAKLGRVLCKAGKTVDGFSELRTAVGKTWEEKDKIDLGACHRQLGDIHKEFAYTAKKQGKSYGIIRLQNAAVDYRRAVTINPNDADAIRSFIEVAREATAIRQSFDNYLMLGGAYLLAGDFPHAKLCYDQCFKLDPKNQALGTARVAYHQSVARSALSSPELIAESVAKVQKFTEAEPDNARWWYILGRLKEHQNEMDKAMEYYHKAEAINSLIDPDLKLAISRLGGSSQNETVGQTASPESINKDNKQSSQTTQAASATGSSQASTSPKVSAKKVKDYAEVEKAMLANNIDNALQQIGAMIEQDPQDGHAWLLKGNILQKRGDLDEAAASYRQSDLFKEPEAGSALKMINTVRVQPNMERAEQFSKDNNWVKAAGELREAIILAPNLSILHKKLSIALEHLGDHKEAQKELDKANELEKSDK
jgi:tetratricopeptide (TPR) repeat protein